MRRKFNLIDTGSFKNGSLALKGKNPETAIERKMKQMVCLQGKLKNIMQKFQNQIQMLPTCGAARYSRSTDPYRQS